MRNPSVNDGLRGTRETKREEYREFPSHLPEAHGKRVFVCNKRTAWVELRPEKKVIVDGVVVVTPQVTIRFNDNIVILDPKSADGEQKIALLLEHEFFRIGGLVRIRDRRDVIEEQETARAAKHLAEHEAIMQDPRMVAKLRQLVGKAGFGLDESGEAKPAIQSQA